MRTHPACHPVALDAVKRAHIIEVVPPKLGLLDHLRIEATFQLHHEKYHMVVRSTRKQDLASKKLVERAANGPDIECRVIWVAKDWRTTTKWDGQTQRQNVGRTDFGRAVEARDEIWCNVVLGSVRRGAKITQLQQRLVLVDLQSSQRMRQPSRVSRTDKDVVWLDVGMHNVTFTQEAHGQEKLMRVGAYRTNVQPDVLAKFLDDIAQVHTIAN
jgi:hypothetical protein